MTFRPTLAVTANTRVSPSGASGDGETWARGALEPHRLVGEDAPNWLATGFALIGAMIAIASVSVWQSASLSAAAQLSPAAVDQTREPDRVTEEKPPPRLSAANDAAGLLPRTPVVVTREPARGDAIFQAPQDGGQTRFVPSSVAETPEPARVAATSPAPPRAGQAASAAPDCFSAFSIPFPHNSERPIMDGVKPSVERLRRWMTEHEGATLLVEGYADATGPEDYNLLLSYSRAKAVASLLRRLGIPERQMTIRAAGAGTAKDKASSLASDRHALLRVEGAGNCKHASEATERQ